MESLVLEQVRGVTHRLKKLNFSRQNMKRVKKDGTLKCPPIERLLSLRSEWRDSGAPQASHALRFLARRGLLGVQMFAIC